MVRNKTNTIDVNDNIGKLMMSLTYEQEVNSPPWRTMYKRVPWTYRHYVPQKDCHPRCRLPGQLSKEYFPDFLTSNIKCGSEKTNAKSNRTNNNQKEFGYFISIHYKKIFTKSHQAS